ncbi:PREDICTED: uncharacterized protein LOC104749020 [Camelina sativa]|uniref:Uncharacterized protein LOC104749020 n=1 Tax=Camelina sativa TaxID=90675 RepID=A0ABM0WC09_CAMSA|nr:PREDICTED: uncharacterized protein LOC104749020 [Camelina sativa]
MNTKNNVVEVSPFFLFEASGDSESHHQEEHGHEGDDSKGREDHGDDAESCRCEPSSTSQRTRRSTDLDLVGQKEEEGEVAGENEDHDDGEGEVNSYRRWSERRDRDSSSTGSEERLVSEIEKNRVFWEACLAS